MCSGIGMVQKYLRPTAVSGGVIPVNWKGRFGFHNFRHSLATVLVKLKVDPKTVHVLRHEDFGTTMAVRAVRHGSDAGCARQVPGAAHGRPNPPAHGASSVRVMGWIVGWKFWLCAAKFFGMWWPGGVEPPTHAVSLILSISMTHKARST